MSSCISGLLDHRIELMVKELREGGCEEEEWTAKRLMLSFYFAELKKEEGQGKVGRELDWFADAAV